MRGVRGVLDDISTSLEEDQGLTAVFGAIAGGFLAFAIERYGADSDPETFTITVDRARASLLSALALVFIGLSIVLAPPVTMSVSVLLLLIITGVLIVWCINGTLQSLRVDRAIRWIGVECTEVLTEVSAELSRRKLGIRTRQRSDGSPRVVVREDTVGDYLDAAGRQILLYGGEDRTVNAALLRLGRQGERFADSDRDRQLARTFADDVEAARAAGAGSEGRAW